MPTDRSSNRHIVPVASRSGVVIAAIACVLAYVAENIIGITASNQELLAMLVIGSVLTIRYMLITAATKQGLQLTYKDQRTAINAIAIAALSWGLVWRLGLLLIPFEGTLLIAWMFLPWYGNPILLTLIQWLVFAALLSAFSALACAWLMRSPYGGYRFQPIPGPSHNQHAEGESKTGDQ